MCSVGVSLPFRSHSLERSFTDRYSEITAMSYRGCYRTAHRCPSMCSIHTNTHTQAQANEIYFIIATAHFYIQILLVALQCGYYALSAFNSNSSQPKPDRCGRQKKIKKEYKSTMVMVNEVFSVPGYLCAGTLASSDRCAVFFLFYRWFCFI